MSDIKLFRLTGCTATELQGNASDLEKPLQTLIEANLQPLLNIRFIASEHSTGKTHGGRIDSLGLDENHCPVILEYKRSVGENVINQGLFYLDWLMDHKAEFKLLVLDKLGTTAADAIDWSAPRVVCIAADFTKYDGHAVQQIGRNIELIRYRRFGADLLLLESVNAGSDSNGKATATKSAKASASILDAPGSAATTPIDAAGAKGTGPDKSFAEVLANLPEPMQLLLASLENYTFSLGDDVQRKELRLYAAFKRLKNFATVVLHRKNCLLLYLHVDPATALSVLPNARDVSNVGHWGTGNLEVTLKSLSELESVKPFIAAAYEGRNAAAISATAPGIV
jgi:predicted transport protein